MKKLILFIFLILPWNNLSSSELVNKFLYCDVQNPDPDYKLPKNFVLKINYKKKSNFGMAYFYRINESEIPDWEQAPFGVQLVDDNIYYLFTMLMTHQGERLMDIFVNMKKMKTYLILYEEPEINIQVKRFESNCKFVEY